MLRTPQEAADLWCPFARAYDSSDDGSATATNRPLAYSTRRSSILCVSEKCMAWRRSNPRSKKGYCGLAGAVAAAD
jgi:hypothetical protein